MSNNSALICWVDSDVCFASSRSLGAGVNHIVIKTMGQQKDKTGMIILGILLVTSLVGTAIGFSNFHKERLKAIVLNMELESTKAEKRIAENKLGESEEKISELDGQLNNARLEITELNNVLGEVEAEREQLYSQIEELQLQIQKYEEAKKEWGSRQIQIEEQIETLEVALLSLLISRNELEVELGRAKVKDEVALGKIVIEQKKPDEKKLEEVTQKEVVEQKSSVISPQSQAAPALKGKVLTVKKNFGFAIIDLGSQDGVKVGDIFSVYRNHRYIGDIQAERIRQITSACSFITKKVRDAIRENDDVAWGKTVIEQKKADADEKEVEEAASPQSQAAPAPALEGKVLTVKRKFDFSVINLGSQDGVKVGDIFSVYRNHRYIGDIQVDKSSEVMGVCLFASKEVKDKIREGDKVIRK